MDVWRHSKLIIIPVTFLGLPVSYTLTCEQSYGPWHLYLWAELWPLTFVPVGSYGPLTIVPVSTYGPWHLYLWTLMAPDNCTCGQSYGPWHLYQWAGLWPLAFVPVSRVMVHNICTWEHADRVTLKLQRKRGSV